MREANYMDPNGKYGCLGEIGYLKFNESFLRAVTGVEDIRSVLKENKEVESSCGLVIYAPKYLPHIPSEGIIGLPEYREDVIWLIFDCLSKFIKEERLDDVEQKYISKWNTLSQVLTDVLVKVNVITTGSPEFEAIGERGDVATDFSFLNRCGRGTWVYELKSEGETASFIGKDWKPGSLIAQRKIVTANMEENAGARTCGFHFDGHEIRIDGKCLEEALKERNLSIGDFSVLQKVNDKDFVIETIIPQAGSFALNGYEVTVDISGRDKKNWELWNKEMFLVLSMVSDYVTYPYPGANSHARDMKYTMRLSHVSFFEFLLERCNKLFAARCLLNYLVFLEAMKKNGYGLFSGFLRGNAATKKNGTLCKLRVCTIEPKEVLPEATDTLRIAFKCRNVTEDTIEVELLCNYCTGKNAYEYNDNCLNRCDFEQFKRYFRSANF